MKRHPSLFPLSHDHHHALAQARRLRRAAADGPEVRRTAAVGFLRFFSEETIRHFREEEERLFPAFIGAPDPAGELVVAALVDHQRLHALVARLDRGLAGGEADPGLMVELADLLEAHVRLEERRLFPLAEEVLAKELAELDLAGGREEVPGLVVDLLTPLGRGPLWGAETEDLNATLLAWDSGGGAPEHVNAERDVLLLVLGGSATVTIDGDAQTVHAGEAVLVEKGRSRRIEAGSEGVRYLTVHRRRAGLQISSAAARRTPS
jgi:quercetin dioxygenase-like cupin family protein/hemerythrin-like domain-containing protein